MAFKKNKSLIHITHKDSGIKGNNFKNPQLKFIQKSYKTT